MIPAGKTMCGLCSRLRRGALYRYAEDHGITKIALGHHRDDIVETLFLNMFHGCKISAMPPKLLSDDGKHVVIRPLAYVAEEDLLAYAALKGFPIIPCNLCGSQETLQRKVIKEMLAGWERAHPGPHRQYFQEPDEYSPLAAGRPRAVRLRVTRHARSQRADAHAWLAAPPSTASENDRPMWFKNLVPDASAGGFHAGRRALRKRPRPNTRCAAPARWRWRHAAS